MLTGFGRMSLVERVARKLPEPAPLVELDVTDDEQLAALADKVREHVPALDGVVHSIGYAPPSCLVVTSWMHPGPMWPPPCRCRPIPSSR